MNRTFLALAAICAVGVGGMALARHDEKGGAKVTQLSRRDIVEKLDGKDARVTVQEVAIEPGGRVAPHRHAGPVFGYVLEGEYEHALDDDPVTTYKAGDTFYEPSGCVHRVTRNPSARQKTRLLAVILHPRDAEKVTVPEEAAKKTDRTPPGDGTRGHSGVGDLGGDVRARLEAGAGLARRPAPRGRDDAGALETDRGAVRRGDPESIPPGSRPGPGWPAAARRTFTHRSATSSTLIRGRRARGHEAAGAARPRARSGGSRGPPPPAGASRGSPRRSTSPGPDRPAAPASSRRSRRSPTAAGRPRRPRSSRWCGTGCGPWRSSTSRSSRSCPPGGSRSAGRPTGRPRPSTPWPSWRSGPSSPCSRPVDSIRRPGSGPWSSAWPG